MWNISGSVYNEIYFRGKMSSNSPSKQSEILENYKKNLRRERRISMLATLQYGFICLVLTILPIFSINQFLSLEKVNDLETVIFIIAFVLGFYSVQIIALSFTFLYSKLMQYMKGEINDFLRTLPLEPSEYKKLSIFVFMRMIVIQGFVILFTLPIIGSVISGEIQTFAILFTNNLITLTFGFYLIINITYKLTKKVLSNPNNPKTPTIITAFTIIIYLGTVFPVFFMMENIIDYVREGIQGDHFSLVPSVIFSLIIPFSSAFTSILLLKNIGNIPTILVISSSLGMIIFLGTLYLLIKNGNRILGDMAKSAQISIERKKGQVSEIQIHVQESLQVLIRNSIRLILRDQGSFGYLFLAMLFPIMFTVASIINDYSIPEFVVDIYFTPLILLLTFIPNFYMEALSQSDKDFGGIISSLPISQTDVYRSKQVIMIVATQISIVIIFLLGITGLSTDFVLVMLKVSFINVIAMSAYLILKSYFFGRLNNRYTLQEINVDNKIPKSILLSVILGFLVLSNVNLINYLSELTELEILPIILINAFYLLIIELIARKLFK